MAMEKLALNPASLLNAGRQAASWGKGLFSGTPTAAKLQLGRSAGGAAMGAAAGSETDVGVVPGAIAGAIGFRKMPRMGALTAPLRTGIQGSLAGVGVDQAAGAVGYDTNHQFAQAGGALGLGAGLGRLVGGGRGLIPGASSQASRGFRDFTSGTFDPLAQMASKVLRAPSWAAGRQAPAWLGGVNKAMDLTGKPTSIARGLGRLTGYGTLGATGLGAGYNALAGRVGKSLQEGVGDVVQAASESDLVPQLAGRFADETSRRMVQNVPGMVGQLPGAFWDKMQQAAHNWQTGGQQQSGMGPSAQVSGIDELASLGNSLNTNPRAFAGIPSRDELLYQQG